MTFLSLFLSFTEKFSNSLRVIKPEHAKIHDGKAFTHARNNLAIPNAGSIDHLFDIPVGVYPHLRLYEVTVTGGPFIVQLYEDCVASSPGTAAEVINSNRNSSTAPGASLFNAPTITGVGTLLVEVMIDGTRRTGGLGQFAETEINLKAGSKYLLRMTNNSGTTQDANSFIFWYE